MADSIVEVEALQKTFMNFTRFPQGDRTVAYVFFQSKDNKQYVVSTETHKVMAAQLRIGKYDRIMKIRRGDFHETVYKEILCSEDGHHFNVTFDITYYVGDPSYIYKNKVYQVEAELRKCLMDMEDDLGKSYSYRDRGGIRKALKEYANKAFETLKFLKIYFEFDVRADEAAEQILKVEREHEITLTKKDSKAVEDQRDIENQSDLEQLKLTRQGENERINIELKNMKAEAIGALLNQYGNNAGYIISQIDGELSGTELADKMNLSESQLRQERFNMAMQLFKEGVISETVIERMVPRILMSRLEDAEGRGEEQNRSSDEKHGKEKKPEAFQWNDGQEDDTIE